MTQEDIPVVIGATPVCCRPAKIAWIFAAVLTVMGGLSLSLTWMGPRPPEAGALTAPYVMATFFFVPAGICAVWAAHARIIADGPGLRWRGLGRWKSARWEDVADYYVKLSPKSNRSTSPEDVVETGAGRFTFTREWTHHHALREVIEQRATSARAQTWGIKGTRPEDDWPRVFHYERADNTKALWFMGGCLLLAYGVLIGPAILKTPGWIRDFGWGLGLGPTLVMLVVVLSKSLIVWAAAFLPLEARQRKHQRITVSPVVLRFEDMGRTIEVSWSDVCDYFLASFPKKNAPGHLYRVVTTAGDFDFTPVVSEVGLLRTIIPLYATEAKSSQWRDRDGDDLLGGQRSRWSGGYEGVGERVFHYRTRSNRAMLWLLSVYAVLPVVPFGLDRCLGLPNSSAVGAFEFSVLAVIALFWTLWRYQAARVQIDSLGITQHTFRGRRFLAWDEVRDFYKSGSDMFIFGNVVGVEGRIRIWLGIADAEELQDEIMRRAIHSRDRLQDGAEDTASLPVNLSRKVKRRSVAR